MRVDILNEHKAHFKGVGDGRVYLEHGYEADVNASCQPYEQQRPEPASEVHSNLRVFKIVASWPNKAFNLAVPMKELFLAVLAEEYAFIVKICKEEVYIVGPEARRKLTLHVAFDLADHFQRLFREQSIVTHEWDRILTLEHLQRNIARTRLLAVYLVDLLFWRATTLQLSAAGVKHTHHLLCCPFSRITFAFSSFVFFRLDTGSEAGLFHLLQLK